MEKTIAVKIAGAGEPKEVVIHPGSTTRDVLAALGAGRDLILTQDPAGNPFGLDETLWDKIENGQKLYAVPPMEVGR